METQAGVIGPRLEADGLVTVDMGVPVFEPARIPFISDTDAPAQPLQVGTDRGYRRRLHGQSPRRAGGGGSWTSTRWPRKALIESHPRFPQWVNAGLYGGPGPAPHQAPGL